FNAVSLDPGLARIKLKVFSDNQLRDEILEHQFLAIWMKLGTPSIHEIAASDPTGGPKGSANEGGDPNGDGVFTPASKAGRLQVKVTGSFPDPEAPGGTFTLPNDWPAMANLLAATSDTTVDNPATLWDIHGFDTPPSVVGPFDPVRPETLLRDGQL